MTQTKAINRRIQLASRPVGAPLATDFDLHHQVRPGISAGQVLLRTVFLSLDPYMRGRMSAAKSYAEPLQLDEVMPGGTISRVEESQHPDYKAGD